MTYSTAELQNKIIDSLLKGSNLIVKPLKTKEDLNITGVTPNMFIQYAGAEHKERTRNFTAVFNIYVVHKTLSSSEKEGIYDLMDKIRNDIISMKIDYGKFISKSDTSSIGAETITEAKSNTFVYMFSLKTKVRI